MMQKFVLHEANVKTGNEAGDRNGVLNAMQLSINQLTLKYIICSCSWDPHQKCSQSRIKQVANFEVHDDEDPQCETEI